MQVGIKVIERTNEDNIIFSFVINGGPVQIYLVHDGDVGEYDSWLVTKRLSGWEVGTWKSYREWRVDKSSVYKWV